MHGRNAQGDREETDAVAREEKKGRATNFLQWEGKDVSSERRKSIKNFLGWEKDIDQKKKKRERRN